MIAHQILLMTLSFVISWGPFCWMYCAPLMVFKEKGPARSTDVLPLLSVKLGCAIINPLVYGFENIEVREQVFT